MFKYLNIIESKVVKFLLFGLLGLWMASAPSVAALTTNDIDSLIKQHPYYDSEDSTCTTTGSTAGGSEALSKQAGLDSQWIDLINKDANKYGADPVAMASILYWENRGWPAFGRLVNGSPARGMGPWQFIADTWANFSEYSADQVYDPVPSTDAAARYIKGAGGIAGSKAGFIDQDFSKGSNIPSMATLMKNYNAGGATYRIPGAAQHLQAGRVWYDGNDSDWANRDADKPKIIDDYIVAGTYLYYQISTGQTITYKDTGSYVTEALAKQDQIQGFTSGGSAGTTICSAVCPTGGGVAGNGKAVVIDPGHAGANTPETDSESGIEAVESTNPAERKQMWETAQIIKSSLEKDGYSVTLTKSAEDDPAGLLEKARRANATNAALAVSLHSTGGDFGVPNDHWGVTPQEVGRYRQNWSNDKEKTFDNAQLAQTSQQYANIIAEERNKVGDKTKVAPLDASFTTNRVKAHGDISIVQLFGKIPWVYNEVGQTNFSAEKYAEGITNGIEKALGGSTATNGSSATSSCGAVAGSIVQTALGLAWPEPASDAKPPRNPHVPTDAYAKAVAAAGAPNGGEDCGIFVGIVMRASGADPDYPASFTPEQARYVLNSEKYQVIYRVNSTEELQAGDILILNAGSYVDDQGVYHVGDGAGAAGHTYIFVGQQSGGYNAASASLDSHMPSLGNAETRDSSSQNRGDYLVARLIQ